jgi:hypothetical protein
MSGIKGMNLGNTNGFKKDEPSLMKGKTKELGLYPKKCGFQVGHEPLGGAIKGRLKGQIPHNKGTLILVNRICLECDKEFKVRKDQVDRGRGKYCSRECYTKAQTIYELSPDRRLMNHLRNIDEYKKWHMDCLKRDYFRCQECFTKNNLEVHHIKSFTKLVVEFLQTYSQFSPIEDKETLLRLATTYEPFWDVNNGQTFCETHHKSLTMKTRMDIKWHK